MTEMAELDTAPIHPPTDAGRRLPTRTEMLHFFFVASAGLNLALALALALLLPLSQHDIYAIPDNPAAGQGGLEIAREELDMSDPKSLVRASLDPEAETVGYFKGGIWQMQVGEQPTKLLGIEGYNIARMVPKGNGGFEMMSREIAFYQDASTGKIIETWNNTLGREVEVVHVANDPVNQRLSLDSVRYLHYEESGGNIYFPVDIFLAYPNPMTAVEYPWNSMGPLFQAAEMYSFTADARLVKDPALASVSYSGSWTRVGQWMPWMEMGQTPGWLVFSTISQKLASFDDLPPHIKEAVERRAPKYKHAPSSFEEPNETTFTVFKRMIDKREAVLRTLVQDAVNDARLDGEVRRDLSSEEVSVSAASKRALELLALNRGAGKEEGGEEGEGDEGGEGCGRQSGEANGTSGKL
ncbi:hypothetical protein T484DRAFT_1799010 [Baffinella frigidus]|nr:hypothetical protein T484DRAFT_1799010 [Cryptophyta sp. CCMP2293]